MKNIQSRGFTLIEMLIALVVLAVLIVVSAPAFRELIQNNRMLSEVYGLRAALNSARSEALAQRAFVTFCRSSDGAACIGADWKDGYIAFRDMNGNGAVDDPNNPDGDQIFIAKVIDSSSMDDIKYEDRDGNAVNMLQFNSRGYARGPGGVSTSGTFTICDYREESDASGIVITAGGVVRAAVEDPNDPGVARDLRGAELDCP
jgi:type IV fimbrial biogenesis protein FimT